MKLLIVCAIFALFAFVQVAHAQEEDATVEEVAPPAAKQEDETEASLAERGNAYGRRRESGRGNRRGLGRGQGGYERGGRQGGGNGNRRSAYIQNIGVTSKVIPGYTEVRPTINTKSRERHDVRSQTNSYYRQNSASSVTQNNKRKQTFIHTHLNQVVYHPRHVNHIHKHHHTTFIKQLYPEVKKVYISQKQKIVEPEKLTIVKYTQDSDFQNKVYPVKVQKISRHQQLKTIRKPVLDMGVRNKGNPLEYVRVQNSFDKFEMRNTGSRNGNYLNGASLSRGGSYGQKGWKNLNERAGEQIEEKQQTIEVKAEVVPEKPEALVEEKKE